MKSTLIPSKVIKDFKDWYSKRGWVLNVYGSEEERFQLLFLSQAQRISCYYQIDQGKAEEERLVILKYLRESRSCYA